jgi:hypothetical protein
MSCTIELAAPHNWCDRRCERCPLSTSCPIPGLADREPEEILGDAVDLLEAICGECGIDPAGLPPPPESIDTRVLREAGRGWADAFMALEPSLADAPIRSVVVAGKVARIAAEKELDDADLWSCDTVPNLLVVERVLATARSDVERIRARLSTKALVRFDEADARLGALLSPLLDAISARDRAVFAALVAAGRAPSPLATR